MTRELQELLDKIYAKAIDPKTSETYVSVLRQDARKACLVAGLPRAEWPAWTEERARWQDRGDRTEEVHYQPGIAEDVIAELEHHRKHNNPAKARALCRALNITPPAWARR